LAFFAALRKAIRKFTNFRAGPHERRMLVQYSDDEDDGEAPVAQDPVSNVKVTIHIPPTQPPTKTDDEEEENYLNLDLVQGRIKRPTPTQLPTNIDDNSDSSDEEIVKTTNKKQKIETCNAIMPTASKAGRYHNYSASESLTNIIISGINELF
jgi:hypothetical protein